MLRRGNAGIVTIVLTLMMASPLVAQNKKGGGNETGPYEVDPNWPQDPCGAGMQIGSVGGIFAESPDRIFVFARGCLPELTDGSFGEYQSLIPSRNASGYDLSRDDPERHPQWTYVLYILDSDGKLVENWDQHNHMFVRPHRVKINPYDPERHVWVVDDGAHQVTKFSHDGSKVVMQLGKFREPGNDETHFGRPTDVAWLPDGTFFVSDGYTNTRVVKFDKDGKFILTWGKKGNEPNETQPGYMNTVHGIAIDDNRRVYVADRANSRIQVFDENGKFLDEWTDIKRPYYIYMSADQHLWISDGRTQKFLKFALDGELLYDWGTFGAFPGGNWGVHQFTVDSDGNLYTADVHVGRVQKYRPRPDANPAHLIGKWRPLSGGPTQ